MCRIRVSGLEPSSTPVSSFLLMHTLRCSSDGSDNWDSATHMGDLNWVLSPGSEGLCCTGSKAGSPSLPNTFVKSINRTNLFLLIFFDLFFLFFSVYFNNTLIWANWILFVALKWELYCLDIFLIQEISFFVLNLSFDLWILLRILLLPSFWFAWTFPQSIKLALHVNC